MRRLATALLTAACVAAPSNAQASADALFADRMTAAALNERCLLFTPPVTRALGAGAALARNALMRGGWSDGAIARAARSASAAAAALPCDGEAAGQISQVVNAGYDGWRQLQGMSFAGDRRTWTAERPRGNEAWLLHQSVTDTDGEPARFGIARQADGSLRLALALSADARPGAARVLIRDAALAPSRLEPEMIRIAGTSGAHPLAADAVPDVFARAVWAADRSVHDEDSPYARGFDGGVAMLWFPEELITDLAALDPRETAVMDIDSAGGLAGRAKRLYLEIGDFAPAAVLAAMLDQASPVASSE